MNTHALDEERDEPLLEAYHRLCAGDSSEPSATVREAIRARARQFILELSDGRPVFGRSARRLWIVAGWAGLGLAAMTAAGLYSRTWHKDEIREAPKNLSAVSSARSTAPIAQSPSPAAAGLTATKSGATGQAATLRLEPPSVARFLEQAQKVVRSRFPDLLKGPGTQNWLVGIVFDQALKVVRVVGPAVMPAPGDDKANTDLFSSATYASTQLGLAQDDIDDGGGTSVTSPGENRRAQILVWAYVLKDAAIRESNARVRAAVMVRLDNHLPRRLASGDVPLLTVLMAADGTIDRDNLEWRASPGGIVTNDMFEADARTRFAGLGASPAELGRTGTLLLTDAQPTGADCCGTLVVSYAWPRTAPAVPADRIVGGQAGGASGFDDATALAILKRHFSTQELSDSADGAQPWVLLGSGGEVLRTGRAPFDDSVKLAAYLEAIYPGIRTDGYVGTSIRDPGNKDRYISANFVWLARDSPAPR